jgi:glutamyl-tRNA synthetase
VYNEHAQRLVSEGRAFRCFCSSGGDVAAAQGMSEAAGNTAQSYPGTCLGLSAEESADKAASGAPHTIRFQSGQTPVGFRDLVYGLYRKRQAEDHFIIMKSDGFPTYHFANVVDDHLMGITHVVRGAVCVSQPLDPSTPSLTSAPGMAYIHTQARGAV